MDQKTFDDLYWASKPPEVAALHTTPDPAHAFELASHGQSIDVPIMIWGWSPFLVMSQRHDYGYTWVPALLGAPVPLAPGIHFPGVADYDPANPPAGSIKVSLDPADYPPFAPPPTLPKPSQDASPLGPKIYPWMAENDPSGWGGRYLVAAWYPCDPITGNIGAVETVVNVGKFQLGGVRNFAGWSRYWTKVGA